MPRSSHITHNVLLSTGVVIQELRFVNLLTYKLLERSTVYKIDKKQNNVDKSHTLFVISALRSYFYLVY